MTSFLGEQPREELAPGMPFMNFLVGRSLAKGETRSGEGQQGPLTGTRQVTTNSSAPRSQSGVGGPVSSDLALRKTEFSAINVIPDFLEEYSETRYSEGYRIAKFVFYDAAWDFLEAIIIPRRNRIRWNFGWVGPSGAPKTDSGERDGIVTYYQPAFTYQGNRLTIEVVDAGHFPDNAVYTRFFNSNGVPTAGESKEPEKARISDIVKFIAEEMGLSWDIEVTKSVLGPFQQKGSTNMDFIEKELLPLAESEAKGLKNYECGIEGSVLVFKPPSYKVVRRYFFARDTHGTMLSFTPTIDKNQIWGGQYSNTTAVGFDPLSKTILKSEIDVNDDSKRDRSKIRVNKRSFIAPRAGSSTAGRLYITPYGSQDLIREYTRAIHEQVTWEIYTATAIIIGDPTIAPYDLIQVVVLTNDGVPHYTSGIYLVTEVSHRIRGGSFTTELKMASNNVNYEFGDDPLGDIIVDESVREDEGPTQRFKSAEPIDWNGLRAEFRRAFGGSRS